MKILLTIFFLISSLFSFSIDSLEGNSSSKTKEEEKVIYKDMLNYLKNSEDTNQLLVLGTLLITGSNIPDSIGDTIKPDPLLGEFYLIKSANLGNIKAYSVLGGLYFMNENLKPLDNNYTLAEKYLKLGFDSGDFEAGVLLSNLYIEKEEYGKGIPLLFNLANSDSSAQLGLAILFKNGLYNKNGEIILNRNIESANQYLNLACNNPKQTDKIKNFCFDSKNIVFNKK